MSLPSSPPSTLATLAGWAQRRAADLGRALPPPPGAKLVSRLARPVVTDLLDKHRPEIAAAKASGDLATLGAIAARMVSTMRARLEHAPRDRPAARLLAWLDSQLPTDLGEHMDDEALPPARRRALMRHLDRATRWTGDYVVLSDLLTPLLRPPPDTTTVLDVASGPGGFALALAGRGGQPLQITATDIDETYLDIGRRAAEKLHGDANVHFRRLDAFALRQELGPERPDLITCMRSLHHFGPAGSVRLLAEMLACAPRGVVVVDIARSVSRMLMAAGGCLMTGDRLFVHDAVVSVRKAFSLEELELVVACVPGGEALELSWAPPAYIVARTRQPLDDQARAARREGRARVAVG